MVSDFGGISVGLWKNCTAANDCSHSLSYSNEGAYKDIVLSADGSCAQGNGQSLGDWVA